MKVGKRRRNTAKDGERKGMADESRQNILCWIVLAVDLWGRGAKLLAVDRLTPDGTICFS